MMDLEQFVAGCAFNLHSARYIDVEGQANASTPHVVINVQLPDNVPEAKIKLEEESCMKASKLKVQVQAKVIFLKILLLMKFNDKFLLYFL